MAGDFEAMEAIRRIESRLGISLPAEYRNFLLAGLPWDQNRRFIRWKAGGGWPNAVEIEEPYHYKIVHSEPFGTGVVTNSTIESVLDIFQDRQRGEGLLPRDAVAVADCPTLENVLLFIRGPRAGQVWLKDWRRLEQENIDEPEDGLHFLAKDFNEFLAKLSDENPDADDCTRPVP